MHAVRKAIAAAILSLPLAAAAQGKDELWEISTQMSMAGLPAGMPAQTSRVCQDKDPAKHEPAGPEAEKCKITDRRQSGNTYTMTMVCPEGKATFENTYNAARTEFKGSMKMESREGNMTMTMSGRKVGSCDAAAERRKHEAQAAAGQRQAAQAQAEIKKAYDQQIRDCHAAVETMDYAKLGLYGQCAQQPDLCKAMAGNPETKPVAQACTARQAEYCRRYRTEEGFVKAKADPQGAQACGVSVEKLKAELCPGALQKESLAFLGRYCPVEARPLAEKHCAGRDFTALRAGSRKGDKYDEFCSAYLSQASLARERAEPESSPQSILPNPAGAVTEGINQGINKLRGIFGR